MKIEARNVARVLNDVGAWRVLLFYGDDVGLIRKRARCAVQSILGDAEDPFRLARLEGDEQERLEEEALALSLVGGRRVVWVRDVQDSVASQLSTILKCESDTLIVLEGHNLSFRSKVRSFAEKHKNVAAIGCYPQEGRFLSKTIVDTLARDRIPIDKEALVWLVARLGSDSTLVAGELEKLRLYGVPGKNLTIDDVRNCVGDSGSSSLEDAIYFALSGERLLADRAFERALADGANPVAFARVTLSVFDRFRSVMLSVQAGKTRAEAMAAVRPPIFFKRKEAFQKILDRWSYHALECAAARTQLLEISCKTRGASDVLLCQRHLVQLCYPKTL